VLINFPKRTIQCVSRVGSEETDRLHVGFCERRALY
jgi:hypothetical protein